MFETNIDLTEIRKTNLNNAIGAIIEGIDFMRERMAIASRALEELQTLERYLHSTQEAHVEAPEAAPRPKRRHSDRSTRADVEEASYAIYAYVENNPGTTINDIAKYLRSVHVIPKGMQEVSVHGLIHRLIKRLDIQIQRARVGSRTHNQYTVRKPKTETKTGAGHARTATAVRELAMNLLKRDNHNLREITSIAENQGLRGSPSDRLSNIVGRVMRDLHKKGTVTRKEEGATIIYSLAEKGE